MTPEAGLDVLMATFEIRDALSPLRARHAGATPMTRRAPAFPAQADRRIVRSLGRRTTVPVEVSVNVAVLGTCPAADLGFQLVPPTDAVVGIPESDAAHVIADTLALLATASTTVDAVIAAWSRRGQ